MDYVIPYDQIGISPPGPWENAAPSSGVEGSIPNADFFPAVQNEILNVQDEAAITRNAADFTQLLQAIRSGKLTAFADTGTADALIVTPRTAYTALAFGVPIQVLKGSAGNATTTPTLAVSGLTRQIVKEDGTTLAVGDLPAGSLFSVISDGSKLRVVGLRKSDAAGSVASLIAANPSISPARNIVSKTTAGTYSFTVPANITWLLVTVVGAGGGGAGAGGPSTWSGGGGGGGGTSIGWVSVTPGQTFTYIVGAKGTGSSQGNGNTGAAGGTSSFGPVLYATGGGGGQAGTATSAGGIAGLGYGGQIVEYGSIGGDGNPLNQNVQGGAGGASSQGGGGRTSTTTGVNAAAPGGGGGGIWQASGGAGVVGGNGADGFVSIQY